MRTYINLRFAQLTIFIAITAGLLNLAFSNTNSCPDPLTNIGIIAAKMAGLLSAPIFYIMEHRATDHFHHYKNRAIKVQNENGYSLYLKEKVKGEEKSIWRIFSAISATQAVRLLFMVVFLIWVALLIIPFVK